VGRYRLLKTGDKVLFFYDSGVHVIVGQAEIKEIFQSSADEVFKKFSNRIFLTEDNIIVTSLPPF